MARIRTVKPEFWDSPGTAKASLRARLFFIALWNWADDYGKGTASAKALIGFAFPNDADVTESDYPSLASELHSAYDVVFYEVDGRPYFFIPKFTKHQRTEKKAASRIPDPPEGEPAGQGHIDGSSVESDGASDAIDGSSVAGTGEQGNRGTGELDSARKRATQLPKDWKPNDGHLEIAKEYGLEPGFQLRAFRDHHEAKGTTYKNWDAAFRNWLNKAKSFQSPAYPAPASIPRKHLPEAAPDVDPDDFEGYAAALRGEVG